MRGNLDLCPLGPFLDRLAGDDLDVVARLIRHLAALSEPRLDPARAGIVGGGCQAEIAEILEKSLQETGRRRDRRNRVERIVQPDLHRSARHELRYAPRAGATDNALAE